MVIGCSANNVLVCICCAETIDGLGSLREGAVPSGSGGDGLLWSAVLRHFKRECKYKPTDVMYWCCRLILSVRPQLSVYYDGGDCLTLMN